MGENNEECTKISILLKRIDEVREVLNEICCSVDGSDNSTERIKISQLLDELIVEYMNQINKECLVDK